MNRNRRNKHRARFGQAWIDSRYWIDLIEWITTTDRRDARLFADAQRRTQNHYTEDQ